MAVTFVVEDGSIVTGANAYLSAADADVYFENHGAPAGWTGIQTVKEEALRMATQALDLMFSYKGVQVQPTVQNLKWPRAKVAAPHLLPSDETPQALQDACAELALRALTTTLISDVSSADQGIEAKMVKVGPIETETKYSGIKVNSVDYKIVRMILRDITTSQNTIDRS